MGINPDEFYHQQQRVQQDHDLQSAKHNAAHGTMETWQIEQDSADSGSFVRDPMDTTEKKPGFFARLIRTITGKK